MSPDRQLIDSLNKNSVTVPALPDDVLEEVAQTPEEPVQDPAVVMANIKEALHNAPEDYASAVERIMELEMRLEDLARAAEIVEITRQFELFEGFRNEANSALTNKITHKREHNGDMNITVVM